MTSAQDLLTVARSRIGITEQPDGSNYVPGITDWYGIQGAWCAMYVSRTFFDAGMPLPASTDKGFAWVSSGFSWMRNQGWCFTDPRQAQPGDLLAWEWDGTGAGSYDHIGIVEENTGSGLITIEGNVSNRVMRLWRDYDSGIAEIARPAYDDAPARDWVLPVLPEQPTFGIFGVGSSGDVVRMIQRIVQVPEDGIYGPQTEAGVRTLQANLGLKVDGVYGPLTHNAVERLFQWLGTQGVAPAPVPEGDPSEWFAALNDARGHLLRRGSVGGPVKVLQVCLGLKGYGVDVDGVYGPNTENAVLNFQSFANIVRDGVVGENTWNALIS